MKVDNGDASGTRIRPTQGSRSASRIAGQRNTGLRLEAKFPSGLLRTSRIQQQQQLFPWAGLYPEPVPRLDPDTSHQDKVQGSSAESPPPSKHCIHWLLRTLGHGSFEIPAARLREWPIGKRMCRQEDLRLSVKGMFSHTPENPTLGVGHKQVTLWVSVTASLLKKQSAPGSMRGPVLNSAHSPVGAAPISWMWETNDREAQSLPRSQS